MKILYVKNNNERAKKFQLKTIIYEKDGQKFVKKEVLCKEALPHLFKMRENYQKLSAAIINPHIKIAPIIAEDETSITFEFIEGISLEKKFYDALSINNEEANKVITSYIELLQTGFKTSTFQSKIMVDKEFITLFGPKDFKALDGELCFDGISNIDLILSNIIYKDDSIYFIDYEWTYDISLPINHTVFRTLEIMTHLAKTYHSSVAFKNSILFFKMERYFVDTYIMKNTFYFYKKNYAKMNYLITDMLQISEARAKDLEHQLQLAHQELHNHANAIKDQMQQILHRDEIIQFKEKELQPLRQKIEKQREELQNKNTILHNQEKNLIYARSIVKLRDKQLAFQNDHITFLTSLTLTRRLKQKLKKILPNRLLNYFNINLEIANFDTSVFPNEIEPIPVATQYIYHHPKLTSAIESEIKHFHKKPLISIVMPVYNIEPKWLDIAIHTIADQWYENWELCIADDKSTNPKTIEYLQQIDHPKIKITYLDKNLNISGATNAALALATGEYIALMDNDDEITPDALYEILKAINTHDADFIYSDEDLVSELGQYIYPHFKPDFSPDLLMSHNYITHFTCFSKALLDEVGYFNPAYNGAQDFELFLRLTEKASSIYHIPKVLYHWRMLESSTCANSDIKPEALEAGRMALVETLQRRGIEGTVENGNLSHYFRTKYTIQHTPLISIIIPFKDKPELLDMCVNSVLERSTYQHYEIIGISNNSEDPKVFELMKELEAKDTRVKFYEYNVAFNYADINNHAVNTYAKGEHILLLNNDIEVIEPTWLEAMLEHSQREEVGCVGAKLYYPNDTIQHAGVIIGLGGYAGHSHKMYRREEKGYFNRLHAIQNLSAVTAACLMIKKSLYQQVDGLDAVKFKVAYNDVDFCLRVLELGKYNIFTPYAELYHHESISRGYEDTPEKIARFNQEKAALFERHKEILQHGDPYYNPNLTHDREDFGYATHVC